MKKLTRNPAETLQEKVYKNACGRNYSMTYGSKSSTYTHEEKMSAYNKMHEEFDKLVEIPLFLECAECTRTTDCLDCIESFYGKAKETPRRGES